MRCVLLLSDSKDDQFFVEETGKIGHQKGFFLSSSNDFSVLGENPDFAFVINYQKVIPAEFIKKVKNGIYVFHSSDLPEGKGWAPIYYSLMHLKNADHVLTMLKINDKVDEGEIIAKAYFKKRTGENADSLREVDNLMTTKLISETIDELLRGELTGAKQEGEGSYYKKRTPEDSEVNPNQTLNDIHHHALAVADRHPAFYYLDGKKFIIKIRPEKLDEFRASDIRVKTFYK